MPPDKINKKDELLNLIIGTVILKNQYSTMFLFSLILVQEMERILLTLSIYPEDVNFAIDMVIIRSFVVIYEQ